MSTRAFAITISIVLAGCGAASNTAGTTSLRGASDANAPRTQVGIASWYSDSLAGHHTASGVPYDPDALTAAHLTLPFGTVVRVTRLDDGRSVEVTINDRGPYAGHDRIVDLSHRAAHTLDIEHRGIARVRLEVLSLGSGARVHHHHAN